MLKPLLLVSLLLGCPPATSPKPDASDGSAATLVAAEASVDSCGLAEQNLLKLGCKDPRGRLLGGPDLHGVSWSQVCRANKTNGVDMKPECLMIATTCAGVEQCR